MEKSLRCTICTWRGSWGEAASAARVAPVELPEPLGRIQAMYEEQQAERVRVGGTAIPRCPLCGHHTHVLKRQSIRPVV